MFLKLSNLAERRWNQDADSREWAISAPERPGWDDWRDIPTAHGTQNAFQEDWQHVERRPIQLQESPYQETHGVLVDGKIKKWLIRIWF